MPKLSENSPLQVSNINDDDRKNCQVTFTFMEEPGNLLKNHVTMKFDELTFILIKK